MSNQLANLAPAQSTSRGVFYPHGIWAPGVRLMRRLQFSAKAVVISLLFAVPVALLGYFFIKTQQTSIQNLRRELAGVEAFQRFSPVYAGVLRARNATRARAGGHDASIAYQEAIRQVNETLRAFDTYLTESGDPMGFRAETEKLKAAWAKASQSQTGMDGSGRTVFVDVTNSVAQIFLSIGDASGLVLDPELDSFYLVNAMFIAMPEVAENLGQMRGWSTYALANSRTAGKELTGQQSTSYVIWAANAENGLKQARTFLDRAIRANPSLESALDLTALDSAKSYLESVKDIKALSQQEQLTPQQLFDRGDTAVARFLSFYDKGLPALHELLSKRLNTNQNQLYGAFALVAFLLLAAAYMFYCFYLVTRGGLLLISKHLQEMAEGNLSRSPNLPWGKDEPALVILDLRKAYESLHQLIRRVRHSARELHTASNEISSASTDLSARTEQTAANLEEQASTMEQIGATVKGTAERASKAATFASDNAQVAESGGKAFSQVVNQMRDIHASSSRIADIIGTIDGIAFQTNILALNAAVEAARAGEAGRGFAVVASEVRSLAQRSAEAAREIKTLISSSVAQISSGTQVVVDAGASMSTVVDNAGQIKAFLKEIALACHEQADGVDAVGRAIQELDRNTQQNAALVEQTSSAAMTLHAQAERLQQEIANFRVA